jgi:fibronectin type 3 domain-containing protein
VTIAENVYLSKNPQKFFVTWLATSLALLINVGVVRQALGDTTPPSIPGGVSAAAISTSEVRVAWSASTDTGGSGLAGYKVYRGGTLVRTTAVTLYVDHTSSPNSQYCYTVVAYDNAGNNSAASSQACATTLAPSITPPSIPGGVSAAAISTSEVRVAWSASTDTGGPGLAGYKVYRGGTLVRTTAVTLYVDHTLSPNSQYCYTVVAYDNAGNNSAASSPACATTLAASITPPSIPGGVSAAAISTSEVRVAWSASTDTADPGLASYNVYRGGTLVRTTVATLYVDHALSPNSQYCYTVVAYDSAGNNSAASSQACATTLAPSITSPSVPTGVSATANSSTHITVTWSASTDTGGSGLAGYKIYRGGAFLNTTTATSYSDSGLSADTQYCYTIVAYDNAGNNSAKSSQACATTQVSSSSTGPPVPSGVNATANSSSQIVVTWNSSSDTDGSEVAGDNVYRNGSLIATTTAMSYTDSGLSPNTQYCYAIVAYDGSGNDSAASAEACATTPALTNAPQSIVPASRLTTWQNNVGIPGGVPDRTTIFSNLWVGASESDIQNALNAAGTRGSNQVVYLPAGTYYIVNGLTLPSYVTLRGAGTNTVLDMSALANSFAVIQFGGTAFPVSDNSVGFTNNFTAGTTTISVSNTSTIAVGQLLQLTEFDDYANYGVTNCGDTVNQGCFNNAQFGPAQYAGQVVEVTSVSGTSVGISQPLYMTYQASLYPNATPYTPACQWSGVEDLMIYAEQPATSSNGYLANFYGYGIKYCWAKGVEGNFSDGDHVQLNYSYRCEIRDSYFHDGFSHGPGVADDCLKLAYFTSNCLIENNVCYRLHISIMLDDGSAGNVVAYNYSLGNYVDPVGGDSWLIMDFDEHGCHTMYNLYEGNIGALYRPDTTHGSSSYETLLRNYMTGANLAIPPFSARGPLINSAAVVESADNDGGFDINCESPWDNLVGNIAGSAASEANNPVYLNVCVNAASYGNSPDYVCYRFGYSDDNGNDSAGIGSNVYATAIFTGNYDWTTASQHWRTNNTATTTLQPTLPNSYYVSAPPVFYTNWAGHTFTWPPLDPSNPNTFSANSLPAGYRFNQGQPIP